MFFFFFSSRRRHTRWNWDWSSDVCSSDLGEGRIHAGETELLPLSAGAAYFALRSGIPLVPIAINGTSWLRFGGRIRVRIGAPITTQGRPTREAVADLTKRAWSGLHDMVAD